MNLSQYLVPNPERRKVRVASATSERSRRREGDVVSIAMMGYDDDIVNSALWRAIDSGKELTISHLQALKLDHLALELGSPGPELNANIEAYLEWIDPARPLGGPEITTKSHGAPAVRGEAAVTIGARWLAPMAPLSKLEELGPDPLDEDERALVVLAFIIAKRSLDEIEALVERRKDLDQALELAETLVIALRGGHFPVTLRTKESKLAGRVGKGAALRRNLDAVKEHLQDVLNGRVRDFRMPVRKEPHRFASCWGKNAYYLGARLALAQTHGPAGLVRALQLIENTLSLRGGGAGPAADREERNRRQRQDHADGRFGRVEELARELARNPPAALAAHATIPGLGSVTEQLDLGLTHLLTFLETDRGAPLPIEPGSERAANELKTRLRQLGERVIEHAAHSLHDELPPTDGDRRDYELMALDFAPSDKTRSS